MHLFQQSLATQAEPFGRLRSIPVAELECFPDQPALQLLDRLVKASRLAVVTTQNLGDIFGEHHLAANRNRQTLHLVFELSDIAGPVVAAQEVDGFG